MESKKNNPLMALIQEENAQAVKATFSNNKAEQTSVTPNNAPAPVSEPPPEPPEQEEVKPVKTKTVAGERDWERFSFVCNKEIIQKVHDISAKEGFTVRDIMELFLQRSITEYEKKYGVAKPKRKKSIWTLL